MSRIIGRTRHPGLMDEDGLCPLTTSSRLWLFEKTLTAVEAEKGILHGRMSKLNDDGTWVQGCALGCFAHHNQNNYVQYRDAEDIQKKNDSFPKATPSQRRQYMIQWLKKQILQMKSNAAQ